MELHISEIYGNHIHPVGSTVIRPTDMETEHTLWGPLSLGLQIWRHNTLWGPLSLGLQIWKQNTPCGVLCH